MCKYQHLALLLLFFTLLLLFPPPFFSGALPVLIDLLSVSDASYTSLLLKKKPICLILQFSVTGYVYLCPHLASF